MTECLYSTFTGMHLSCVFFRFSGDLRVAAMAGRAGARGLRPRGRLRRRPGVVSLAAQGLQREEAHAD